MKLKVTLALLAFSAAIMAQVNNQPVVINTKTDVDLNFIPKCLSYDGNARVYTIASDDKINIYDNGFQYLKSINFTPARRAIRTEQKERDLLRQYAVAMNKERSEYTFSYYDEEQNGWVEVSDVSSMSMEQLIGLLHRSDGHNWQQSTNDQGETILFTGIEGFADPEVFGNKYPFFYIVVTGGKMYHERVNHYEVRYEYSEWRTLSTRTDYETVGVEQSFLDCDATTPVNYSIDGILLSQTFFNDDARAEYLIPTIGGQWVEESYVSEYTSSPVTTMNAVSSQYRTVGFSVWSEDGSKLLDVTFPEGVELYDPAARLVRLGGSHYVLFSGETTDDNVVTLVYQVMHTPSGTQISPATESLLLKAFPNPASRHQTVTLQLTGERTAASELQIVNAAGQVTARHPISAGTEQTTVPAAAFSPGMNIVSLRQGNKTIGTARVLVK